MHSPPTLAVKPDDQREGTQQDEAEHDGGLGGHVAILIVYGMLVAAIAGLSALAGKALPGKMSTRDLVVTAVAAHKLSRTLTKDAVTSPLRSPFTEHEGDGGPGEVMESPKHSEGLRGSLGELLTCPFCFDVWAITALTVGQVFAPRVTQLCVDALATLAGADFLHLAYAKAQQVAE
ncbi:DUF1360 domain-containing protein [Rhodococcus erythropolis]|uniref:DUF1360 domain-containing protein n=1 Tax=Rhodococcus erythropolis TaxID=1833 RepID=UPI001BE73348|nr:DUF1360 domain-containing protein [Rhodococcus erythropolis]MBT2264411.1 DUF1360 domain-containing protein [Rhodococcus erythropolis]